MVDVRIHKVFEGIAIDSPRSIAVVSECGILTYQELDDRAECVADFLGNQGVRERIAAIWSEVLGVQDLGRHESFFELGGHSLLATRVNSQLRACFGIEIPLRALFDNPTIRELGEMIESARRAGQRAPSGLPDGALREEVLF